MNRESVQTASECGGTHVCLPIPIGDRDAFSHDATPDILHILADNPETTFSNRDLHRLTEKGMSNVNAAVLTLEELGVIRIDRDGRANRIRINPETLIRSDDPVTTIPQSEYHAPVRTIRDRIVDQIGDDAGVVVFGSVARGEADRASDIDVFVVVENSRIEAQRNAHTIEDNVASERFDGDRYEPHIVVETRASAPTHDRIRDVLVDGITIRETPVVKDLKQEVFSNGA